MAQTPAQIAYCAKLDAARERIMRELVAEFGPEKAAEMDPENFMDFDDLAMPSPPMGTYLKTLY